MSGTQAPQKVVSEILVETISQTATLARHLAELLNQVARLAEVMNIHQEKLKAKRGR
jgi:hypothetical protein